MPKGDSSRKDWSGHKYGKITFTTYSGKSMGGKRLWNGICECGTPVCVSPSQARIGKVSSCGCTHIKDLTGYKCGKLTFIENTGKQSGTNMIWKALCECGNYTYTVKKNNKQSCGCIDEFTYTNYKKGRLTLIKRSTTKASGSATYMWEALCECGTECRVIPHHVVNGNVSSCGCLKKDMMVDVCKELGTRSRKYPPHISTARDIWSARYADGCDFDTFLTMSQELCHYCGSPPTRTWNVASGKKDAGEIQKRDGNFTYNGLDRVDSTRDHSVDNIVPCCTLCNSLKSNLTTEEFYALASRMHAHYSKILTWSHQGKKHLPKPQLDILGLFDLI